MITFETIMTNTQEDFPLIKATASEGKMLTNGDIIIKTLYYSKNDPMAEWYEIDSPESNEIDIF